MRKPHYLKGNSKNEMPTEFIFFDVETRSKKVSENKTKAELLLGWCVYQQYDKDTRQYKSTKWHEFRTIESFWQFVFQHNRSHTKLYIYAHNAGGFDLMVMRFQEFLEKAEYKCQSAILQCPPTSIKYYQKSSQKTIVLSDTLNYFRESLASLGKAININKTEAPFEIDTPELSEYCKNDVLIISEAMRGYMNYVLEHNMGNFRITAPSQAMNCYRHRFMKTPLFVDCNELALTLARESYHGGRTEAFFLGKTYGKFYVVDINSMYPFVMANNEFPTQLQTVRKIGLNLDDLQRYINEFFVIANVTVKTDKPCFPYKDIQGRLIFPVGYFETTLAQPELLFALQRGYIRKVNSLAMYQKAKIFQDYVAEFYELKNRYRKEKNQAFYNLSKLFLNSLYGKFGQRGYIYDTIGSDDVDKCGVETIINADTGEIKTVRYFAGLIQEQKRDGESSDSIPSIASAVTSYARLYLYQLIEQAQAGSGVCYYVDTDSLIVNEQGYENLRNLLDDNELGKLKLEETIKYLDIRGLKDYVKGEIEKIKGVRKNAVKISENVYTQDTFQSIKGAIHKGNVNEMIITKTTKHLTRIYSKAQAGKGWLKPIKLGV